MDKLLSMTRTHITKDWIHEKETDYKWIPLTYTTRNAAINSPPSVFSWRNMEIPRCNKRLPLWNRPKYGEPMAKKYKCQFPDCTYEKEEVTDTLTAILLLVHSTGKHTATGVCGLRSAKCCRKHQTRKIWRPTISAAGSREDWSYYIFLTCWGDNGTATNVAGKDKVIQLLECGDKELHKDLTWNGSLTDKTADEVMEGIKKLALREKNMMVAGCNSTIIMR